MSSKASIPSPLASSSNKFVLLESLALTLSIFVTILCMPAPNSSRLNVGMSCVESDLALTLPISSGIFTFHPVKSHVISFPFSSKDKTASYSPFLICNVLFPSTYFVIFPENAASITFNTVLTPLL